MHRTVVFLLIRTGGVRFNTDGLTFLRKSTFKNQDGCQKPSYQMIWRLFYSLFLQWFRTCACICANCMLALANIIRFVHFTHAGPKQLPFFKKTLTSEQSLTIIKLSGNQLLKAKPQHRLHKKEKRERHEDRTDHKENAS